MHYIESAELVRVAVPTEAAERGLLVRRLDTLATLDHPHLVPLIAISPNGSDNLDVRLSSTGVVDLPTAVGSRGPLTAAEGAGLTVAIAQALAALHSVGLVHGGVRATDVLLGRDGQALLRPRVTLPDPSDEPVDLMSLATLVESVLGFPGPSLDSASDDALRGVLARARAVDPRDRPEPGTFAALVAEAVKPAPVRLPEGSALVSAALSGPVSATGDASSAAQTPRAWRSAAATVSGSIAVVVPPATATRRQRRRAMPVSAHEGAGLPAVAGFGTLRLRRLSTRSVFATALIAAGLVAGITVGVTTLPEAFGDEDPTVAEVAPEPATQQWGGINPVSNAKDPAGAAAELTERRLALLAGAVSDIGSVNAEGSAAYAADQKVLDELKQAGAQVVGASAEIGSTELVTVDAEAAPDQQDADAASNGVVEQVSTKKATEAVVRIKYTITAHMQLSSEGETAVPASRESADLTLVWTPGGWRVSEVR